MPYLSGHCQVGTHLSGARDVQDSRIMAVSQLKRQCAIYGTLYRRGREHQLQYIALSSS